MVTACASTSLSAATGSPTSCAAWPSAPPTSPSYSATSSASASASLPFVATPFRASSCDFCSVLLSALCVSALYFLFCPSFFLLSVSPRAGPLRPAQTLPWFQRMNRQPRNPRTLFLKLFRVRSQHRKRRIMHRNHVPHTQQFHCVRRLPRPHRVVIPNRQQCHIRLIQLSNQFHISKNASIPSVIDRKSPRHANHKSRSLAAVQQLVPILDPAGMKRMRHGHGKLSHALRPSFIHFRALLAKSFARQPSAKFRHAHHSCIVLPGQRHHISEMIAMPMRNKKHIDLLHLLQLGRAARIMRDKRIDDPHAPRRGSQRKRRMPKISNLVALGIQHGQFSSGSLSGTGFSLCAA